MPIRAFVTLLLAGAALVGCQPAIRDTMPALTDCRSDPQLRRTVQFDRSPGGVPEVDADWVRSHHCDVRVVDVREPSELAGPLGRLPFAEHVPLDRLADEAEAWSADDPVVLVCRSGRRSARAARVLEDLGFARASSMTGGMLAWHDHGYPVDRVALEGRPHHAHDPRGAEPFDRGAIAAHLGDPHRIRWVKVAALLLQGTQSCVDGRDTRAVVGTPGGDAGELLLALAAGERVRGAPYREEEIGPLLDAYLDAFGRFYMHTDRDALRALGAHLAFDRRFSSHLGAGDPEAIERLVRRPPRALEQPLLRALTQPEHVGCGHLRLALMHPDEYGVRTELGTEVLRAVLVRLWRGDAIDFVVLDGDHHEDAVLDVVSDSELHAFTRVPTVTPHIGGRELFVNHPQVSRWLREQNASFLFDADPWLRARPDRQREYLAELDRLGAVQLAATLRHLAPELPVYEAHVSEHQVRVEGPIGGAR